MYKLSVGIFILFYFGELERISSQPDGAQCNGHVPDAQPVFTVRRIYGVHYREGVPNSTIYGPIPSNEPVEQNRLVRLAEGVNGTADYVGVYDLYETRNSARTTVNGFLCLEANDQSILLQKTADSAYNKIRFDRYLTDQQAAALELAQELRELMG